MRLKVWSCHYCIVGITFISVIFLIIILEALLLLCFSVVPLPVPSLPLPSSLPLSHSICGWLVESDGSQKRTHGPLCLFICPPVPRSFHCTAPSIPLLSCPISLLPLRASTRHPPPDTPTLYPLSSPFCPFTVLCARCPLLLPPPSQMDRANPL